MAGGLEPGTKLRGGRYEIERLLRAAPGKVVYRGRDLTLDCDVVVDVIPLEAVDPVGSAGAWEARVLGRLGDHPNLATVIDHWQETEAEFMVSRYLPGGSLAALIDEGNGSQSRLPVDRVLHFAVQLASALTHIHGRRIVYRDLQPRNVLIDSRGDLRLVDFDTAISMDNPAAQPIPDGRSIEHIAPEVAAHELADERSDLFSLGTTIYAMCTGRPPHTGTRDEISRARSAGSLHIERSDVPDGLKTLVAALMSPAREDRPASSAEVLRVLEGLVEEEKELDVILRSEVTAKLEFMPSLRTPLVPTPSGEPTEKAQRALERETLQAIAAFLNTSGGTLVIGVDRQKEIVGIEVDYPRTEGSREGWRRAFDNVASKHLGPEAMPFIDVRLAPWREITVAVVRCHERDRPTFLDEEFFVRRTATTEQLSAKQAWTWCQKRWRAAEAAERARLDRETEGVELELRRLIATAIHDDDRRLPPTVYSKVKERFDNARRRNPALRGWSKETLVRKLEFADLRHLRDIITDRKLWPLFESRFRSGETFDVRFTQFVELRNSLRHSRQLDDVARHDGEASLAWLRRSMAKT